MNISLKLAVGLHQLKQVFAIDLDHLARFLRAHPNQNGASGQDADFPGELPRQKQGHRFLDTVPKAGRPPPDLS